MVFSMKKLFILIGVLILALSVTTVSAGLFGPDTIENKYFSIEIPDGYYKPNSWGYADTKYEYVRLVSDADDNLDITLTVIGESQKSDDQYDVVENFTEDGITFKKSYGGTILADFVKEGHNYTVRLNFEDSSNMTDLNNLNMRDYVDLIKNVRDSLKRK